MAPSKRSVNNQYIGYITLQYDAEADAVSLGDYGYRSVGEVGTAYDKTVEAVVADYARRLVTMLPTLAVSGVTVSSKYDYAEYTAQVMLRAFGADYSCGNYGGLRGTGGVTAGQPINEANLYEVIPFDNTVYLLRLRGRTIYRIYTENEDNWYFGAAAGVPNPDELAYDDTLYTFAVIDYVYTGTYFSGYRSAVLQEDETGIILRDLLVADVKAHGDAGARWTYADGAMLEPVDWSKGG